MTYLFGLTGEEPEYTKAQLLAATVLKSGRTNTPMLVNMRDKVLRYWMRQNLKTPIDKRSAELAERLGGLWVLTPDGTEYVFSQNQTVTSSESEAHI